VSCDHFDVAIVGAGPTGLTLANLLGQAGCRVALVERNLSTVQEPRAVSIDDESLRTMQAIGLADEAVKDIALDYGSHYFTTNGVCFLKVEPTTREYGFPRRNAFTQPKLEATLRAGLGRFSEVTTLFGHECESFAPNETDVAIALRAPDGRQTAIRASYLVGCDGARSAIRKAIGATLVGSTYQQRWLIVDLANTRERLRQTRVVCSPHRPLITLPGPNGIRRYEFMLGEAEADETVVTPGFVRQLLAAHGPDADAEVVRRQVYTFHARIADRWRMGRVFLAGDAAHLSPPFAGQGMNSGIRDAHNLGWKLAEVVKRGLGASILDTYQAERAPHARALIELAMQMGRIMMPTSRGHAFLTSAAFRLTRFAPKLQSYFGQMKYKPKPFYREGFIDAASRGINLVGRMLPQPIVERRDRTRVKLDDLLGPGFALLVYGPDAPDALTKVDVNDFGFRELTATAVLPPNFSADISNSERFPAVRDAGDGFAPFIVEKGTVALLVRPDRYIAAATFVDRQLLHAFGETCRALGGVTRRKQ
jgi:3-(3-hydroxy-phenyl)propionate hydroxylase